MPSSCGVYFFFLYLDSNKPRNLYFAVLLSWERHTPSSRQPSWYCLIW